MKELPRWYVITGLVAMTFLAAIAAVPLFMLLTELLTGVPIGD